MAPGSVKIASASNQSHTFSMLIKLITAVCCILFIQLALKHGRQTAQLVPPHKFVPWVVVDGKPLYNVSEHPQLLDPTMMNECSCY
jgi:hypothetical protein